MTPPAPAPAKPQFIGPRFPKGTDPASVIRESLRLFLIYHAHHEHPEYAFTPVCSRRVFMPEEFTIAVALFHLSCVVRYKPEYLDRLCTTRFWPVIESLRRHAMMKFLMLFWSFMQQRTFLLEHD